jgi:hypothetical protein
MNNWETFLLKFIQVVAPAVENLFIHNQKSLAVFNASDAVFNGVVDIMTAQQQQSTPPPTK